MLPASVLLVDDDSTFRRVVTQFLQELGDDEAVVVDSAEGGFEGLIKAHSLQPDILLVEVILPDLHGLEVIARLRRVVPAWGSLP